MYQEDKLFLQVKKEDKAKIIEKYKVGDVIKNAVVKGYSNFGLLLRCKFRIRCFSTLGKKLVTQE